VHLFSDDRTVVISVIGIEILYIIQYDIMDFSKIERIIIGTDCRPKFAGSIPITHIGGVIVVVSYSMENRSIDLMHFFEVFRECIAILLPVGLPGHIAQSQGVHFRTVSFIFENGLVYICQKSPLKLRNIIVSIGQVHISQYHHDMFVVVGRCQFKILYFNSTSRRSQSIEKKRQAPIAGDLVITRNRDKNITVFFGGRDMVGAVTVG